MVDLLGGDQRTDSPAVQHEGLHRDIRTRVEDRCRRLATRLLLDGRRLCGTGDFLAELPLYVVDHAVTRLSNFDECLFKCHHIFGFQHMYSEHPARPPPTSPNDTTSTYPEWHRPKVYIRITRAPS